MVLERCHPLASVLLRLHRSELVRLGEDDGEGHRAFAEPVDEVRVNLHRVMTDVDEHEGVDELLALQDVRRNHLVELLLHGLRSLCEAITRKVHEIPLIVDDKVIDEQRLAGRGRRFGKSLAVAEHVDEARLAHVGASDERKLGLGVLRALAYCSRRYREF